MLARILAASRCIMLRKGPWPAIAAASNQVPSTRCCDQLPSNHSLDYGFTILMPLSIIPSIAGIEAPAISCAVRCAEFPHHSFGL